MKNVFFVFAFLALSVMVCIAQQADGKITVTLTGINMIYNIMPSSGLCRVTTISRLALSRNSFAVLTISIKVSISGT